MLEPALELGTGVAYGGRFWATALRSDSRASVALLASITQLASGDPDRATWTGPAEPARLLELASSSGEVAAPRLAADELGVVVAVQEAVSGGHQVRVARLSVEGEPVAWRPTPVQRADESSAFDVALRGSAAVVVWDEWSTADGHGVVMASQVDLSDGAGAARAAPARRLSEARVDAESPRIVSGPEGYWVAWVVNAPRATPPSVYDPERKAPEATRSLSHGPRWIQALPLNEAGLPRGGSRRVTPGRIRVVAFDLAPDGDGGAHVLWRQGAPSPAAPGGQAALAHLALSGVGPRRLLGQVGLGAGVPSLLPAGPQRAPWVILPDERDALRLLRWGAGPGALSEVHAAFVGGAVLAARGSRLLVALPQAAGIELGVVACGAAE